jgi:putative peptide zinc metalloprotease protein
VARHGSHDTLIGAPLPFGSTSRQVSSILAKGLRCPKLRLDLRISQQTAGGKRSYVIKIPETNSYYRFGALEYEMLRLCDGSRTPAELAKAITARHPEISLSETHAIEFLDTVEPAMWERSSREQNVALLERMREERKSHIDHSSIFNIRFRPWNPDKMLTAIAPYLRWVFTRGFVLFSAVLCLTALYLLVANWTRIVQDTEALYSFESRSFYDICWFWILFLGLEAIHEFGHGLACKHFGGEVRQMGFSLVYFTPSFYLDTTDMLLLERRWRHWVIFSGIWIELVVWGLATLVWALTLTGTLINDLAYMTLLLSGIDTLVWNLNPLIKADGYYALADYLDIDNLAENSLEYLRAWARKYILREQIDLPEATSRLRRIFLTYGLAFVANSVAMAALLILFARNVLINVFGDWGYLFFACLVYFLARKSLRASWQMVRNRLGQRKEQRMARKLSRMQQAAVLGITFLLFVPPVPSKVASDFVLEPGRRVSVRTRVSGKVSEVLVREGDRVKEGQVLGLLQNPEVEANALRLSQELALASSGVRSDEFRSDTELAAEANRDRVRLQTELSLATEKKNALEIRASSDGTITTPMLDQKVGEFIPAGNEFCQIVDRRTVRARILVRDWELQDVKPGAVVNLKLLAFPYRTYSVVVEQILPAAALDRPVAQPDKIEHLGHELTNYFALVVDLQNTDDSLREGMTGTAKLTGKRRPLAWLAGRSVWRWLRGHVVW